MLVAALVGWGAGPSPSVCCLGSRWPWRQQAGTLSTLLHFAPPSLRCAASSTYIAAGSSISEWPDVSAFYGQWTGFSAARDFSWAELYNPASAPNRVVRGHGVCVCAVGAVD